MHNREPQVATSSVDAVIIRRLLTFVFLLGSIGTGVELLLLGHIEELAQLVPIVLLAGSLVVLGAWLMFRGPRQLRAFQATMLLFIGAGLLGMWLHYTSNMEFELEMSPSIRGTELFREAVTGAIPTLAPGTMLHLGLIGLMSTYRHPVFRNNAG